MDQVSQVDNTYATQVANRPPKVYFLLYFLNFMIIVFLSLTIGSATDMICNENLAFSFLKAARCVPNVPWKIPTYGCLLFCVIVVVDFLQRTFSSKTLFVSLLYLLNIFFCAVITYLLDFSYKGLFLLLIAEAFLNVQAMPLKVTWLALAFVGYIVFDYDFLTVTTIRAVPLQSYINSYAPSSRIFLYGIKTSLDSINLILVIIFFYQLIQGKIYENKEFIKVNTELQKNIKILENMTEEVKEAERIKERNRLAHEIHDILGHSLTCIDTGLEACIVLARSTNQELSNQLKKIKDFAHTGLLDIRASVHELEKDTKVDQPLDVTIASLVSSINEAKIGHAALRLEGDIPALEADERQTVYRLVQESITNAITHGKAQNIIVSLTCDNARIEVTVSDDGLGTASIHKNFGLRHMEEQVDLLGGEISFRSEINQGFTVHAVLPIRRSTI